MNANLGTAFAEQRAELARSVNAATERFDLSAREHLSIATSVSFKPSGAVVLQQLAMPAGAGTVTLTRGQAEDLMNKIAEQIGLEMAAL